MGLCILDNFMQECNACNNTENDFLNYVYSVLFTSYLEKTFKQTRNKYIFRKIRSQSIETLYEDQICENIDIDDLDIDIIDKLDNLSLIEFFNSITDKQKIVICDYYMHKKSENDISRELGISKQAVNRIRNRALKHLYNTRKTTS